MLISRYADVRAEKEKVKRTRAELYRNVDADYYGYRDDEDGELEPLEQLAEERGTVSGVVLLRNERAVRMTPTGQRNWRWMRFVLCGRCDEHSMRMQLLKKRGRSGRRRGEASRAALWKS